MNIAMYVRVSTQQQAQTQTIEQQLFLLREYSQKQGWEWDEEHIFRDDGYSGASLRRPGLDRLRDQVRNAAFDRVLVTAPDRLARNYVHQMLLMEEFERGGCQIEFVDQPMSRNPHDQLLVQIRGAVAEYERSLIAERMRRGRQQKYRAGILLPWTLPPYGYRVDPSRPRDPAGVRVEPAKAAVVAEMFERYQRGHQSLVGLTKHLMRQQIPTPRGKVRWNQATLRGILSNPVYTGTVFLGRYRVARACHRQSALRPVGHDHGGHPATGPHEWEAVAQVPAIITQEQFDLVQSKFAHNQQFAAATIRLTPICSVPWSVVGPVICRVPVGIGRRRQEDMPTIPAEARAIQLSLVAMRNVTHASFLPDNSTNSSGRISVRCSCIPKQLLGHCNALKVGSGFLRNSRRVGRICARLV